MFYSPIKWFGFFCLFWFLMFVPFSGILKNNPILKRIRLLYSNTWNRNDNFIHSLSWCLLTKKIMKNDGKKRWCHHLPADRFIHFLTSKTGDQVYTNYQAHWHVYQSILFFFVSTLLLSIAWLYRFLSFENLLQPVNVLYQFDLWNKQFFLTEMSPE